MLYKCVDGGVWTVGSDNDMVMAPRREKGESPLPATGLLLLNPADIAAAEQLATPLGGRRDSLFNSRLWVIPGADACLPFFVAGPAVGAPMAVLTLEKFVARGARQILVFGWCGSLAAPLAVGDLVLPTWALSEEGTSQHYPLSSRPESSVALREALAAGLRNADHTVAAGPVWTIDAPYREDRDKVVRYGQEGILGVEMEFAALCTVAAFRKVELAAVLLVSDELWRLPWRPGFREKKFKEKRTMVLRLLLEMGRQQSFK